jgi:hypothetical protein
MPPKAALDVASAVSGVRADLQQQQQQHGMLMLGNVPDWTEISPETVLRLRGV